MNIADLQTAMDTATRLALVKQVIAEGPTAATFHITTPAGTHDVALTSGEWMLGLQQIQNECKQTLVTLGVTGA